VPINLKHWFSQVCSGCNYSSKETALPGKVRRKEVGQVFEIISRMPATIFEQSYQFFQYKYEI